MLIIVGCGGYLFARSQLMPDSFGRRGQYRAEALEENAARPTVIPSQSECLACHVDVAHQRAESLHKVVHCMHCHGPGSQHVAQARAAQATGSPIEPAQTWDGDFLTRIDLYTTKDRATCLACHEARIGMPESFKKIVVDKHLEDMGAENPASRESCFECHAGHDTAP